MRSKLIAMTALALAIGGCQRPDVDHPKTDYTTSLLSRMSPAEIDRVTVPPAPAERGPIPPNANAADPATNASLAFPNGTGKTSRAPPPDNSPDGQHAAVMAEEAAARAADTAAADEAKRKIYEEYAARASVAANSDGSGANNSTNGSRSAAGNASGVNDSGTISRSSEEPVASQSNGSSVSAPMATENAPRPTTLEKS